MTTAEALQISKEEKRMANEVVYTKEQYDALKAELDQFKAVSQQATKDEIDGLKAQIAELSTTISSLSSELEASKEVSIAKETKVVALETELTDANAKLAVAVQSIRDAEIEAINASRKALLLERVDADKVDNLIQKFANASQEMFDALVDSLPVKAKCDPATDDEEDPEEKKGKADEVVVTDLEDAKAEDGAEMASGGTQEEETLRSKASAWFSSNVLRSTHNKQ
jgi:chromosome segregation ATPase